MEFRKEACGQTMKVVARIHNDFPTKFGIPRQGSLMDAVQAVIVFEPEYRDPEALRGLEEFSHIWLIWEFSENVRETWSPTVRPPRLGGNMRMGVFATRSPFRPNPLGLSCVKLERVKLHSPDGPVLCVSGADLMDGTPIYDIKPFLPYADNHPDARSGFVPDPAGHLLTVDFPPELLERIPEEKREALLQVLSNDPRPGYHGDPGRVYGFAFGRHDIRFRVEGDILRVCEIGDFKKK